VGLQELATVEVGVCSTHFWRWTGLGRVDGIGIDHLPN